MQTLLVLWLLILTLVLRRNTAQLHERVAALGARLKASEREQDARAAAWTARQETTSPERAKPSGEATERPMEATAPPLPFDGPLSGIESLPEGSTLSNNEAAMGENLEQGDLDAPSGEVPLQPDTSSAPQPALPPVGSPQPRPQNDSLNWERWLGVRGAALVGGIALVFAGIFFVQVAIEKGWLNAAMRDSLAVAAGVIGLALHRPLLHRGHRTLGESVGGAGTVLILGGAWAAAQLHDLIPHGVALLVMGSAIGAALLLALRSNAQVLTAFALIGGYATPLLLDTAATSSYSLIGFLVILNGSLLAVSRVAKWSWVGVGGAAGTFLVQFAWLTLNDTPGGPWGVALSLGIFPILFGSILGRQKSASAALPPAALLALLAPAMITLLTAPEITTTTSLWPVTALMGVLILAARLFFRSGLLTLTMAMTAAVTLTVMALRTRLSLNVEVTDWVWVQWAGGMCLVAATLLIDALRARSGQRPASSLPALAVASIALFAAPFVAHQPEWLDLARPFTIGIISMSLIATSAALMSGRVSCALIAGPAAGFAISVIAIGLDGETLRPDAPLLLTGVALSVGTALLMRFKAGLQGPASAIAASTPIIPLFAAALSTQTSTTPVVMAVLTGAAALGVSRAPRRTWSLLVTALVAAGAGLNVLIHLSLDLDVDELGPGTIASFCVLACALAMAALWRREEEGNWAEGLALLGVLPALAIAVAAPGSKQFTGAIIDPSLGVDGRLLLLLGGGAALGLVRLFAPNGRSNPRARAVVEAATAALIWTALSKLISFDWPTVALAGAAAAFAFFVGRARGVILATLSGLAVTAAGVGLVFSTYVLNTFSSEPFLIPLDVTIDHTLVGVALVAGLLGLKVNCETQETRKVYFGLAFTLLAVAFSWINAVILNHFSTDGRITLAIGRMQSRDLVMSLAWTAFAISILAVGIRRRASGLRWASLLVLIATVLKVFLYDLGALEGLARVGSFLGLALSLLGVSLLYGKVLGRDSGREALGGDNLLTHDDDDPQPDA